MDTDLLMKVQNGQCVLKFTGRGFRINMREFVYVVISKYMEFIIFVELGRMRS